MNIYAMKKPKRINSVSVGLALLAAVFAYAVWAFLPVFWPLWQVSGMMRTACAIAYNEGDDEKVLALLLKDARRSRLKISEDNFRFERHRFTDEEIEGAKRMFQNGMRAYGKECIMQFRYVDQYELPLFGLTYEMPYESTIRYDLKRSDKRTNVLNEFFYSCSCVSTQRVAR